MCSAKVPDHWRHQGKSRFRSDKAGEALPDSTASAVVARLVRAGIAEVDHSTLTRGIHSTDASLYRVEPIAVVRPRHTDEVAAVIQVCRETGTPLTARGAGTSIAGNAVGRGIVLDFSRHLHRILDIDPDAGEATVEPGVVHADLQRAAAPLGLRFGPDPSSGSRATIGGMIGNNACGTRALAYGRTSDNVLGLDVLTAQSQSLALRHDAAVPEPLGTELRRIVSANLATIRLEFGRLRRQASGYALEHLLPERGFDVPRTLVGSEGTLTVITRATLRLVRSPAHRLLLVLGYPDMPAAGDAVPSVLAARPTACEGIDGRIVDVVRARRGRASVPDLPAGGGWLFVELTGDDPGELAYRAAHVAAASGCLAHRIITDQRQVNILWRLREDGAGLSGVSPAGLPAHAGWEDSAVPPDRLGDYLRDFEHLIADHGLTCVPYGHFGDGCLHARLDFRLDATDGASRFRSFLIDAATLVTGYGGSLSGEHGDGRARSELLSMMYSADSIAILGAVKAVFDPSGILNPGVIVDPVRVDADLRVPLLQRPRSPIPLTLSPNSPDLAMAVHQCTGVGKCRADGPASGDVMCPSYLATREEKDSTRGRARALQEMLNGSLFSGGWRSPEVHQALDLCLSCKGCLTDCPTGIDMAAYKAEVLYRSYRRRVRPRAHYTVGWLPRWAAFASLAPLSVNRVLGADQHETASRSPSSVSRVTVAQRVRSRLRALGRAWAGLDPAAPMPAFAAHSFRSLEAARRRSAHGAGATGGGHRIVLWVDTFTNRFAPQVAMATVELLERNGYQVELSPPGACCGITWISTGQLDAARRKLSATVAGLIGPVAGGALIVGMEPSCTAVLKAEAPALLGTAAAREVAGAVRTLAELLTDTPGWSPPDLTGIHIVAQPHCHHSAVLDWGVDDRLLASAGATVTRVGGCCGLAGNFGVEAGHRAVSKKIAETALLPAIRDRADASIVLADGFSCRLQIGSLSQVTPQHLAQLLARPPRAALGHPIRSTLR